MWTSVRQLRVPVSTKTGSPHGVQAERGGSWRRGGESVCYYENHYESDSKSQLYGLARTHAQCTHSRVRTHVCRYTLTFTLTFAHDGDSVYEREPRPPLRRAAQRRLSAASGNV